jgi:hypothetical protein
MNYDGFWTQNSIKLISNQQTSEGVKEFSVFDIVDLLHAVVVRQEDDQQLACVGAKQLELWRRLPPAKKFDILNLT